MPLLVANHKANLSAREVSAWIREVGNESDDFGGTIIFCPSSPFLAAAAGEISSSGYNIQLGSQDISRFEKGAHTGEVAASQIADIVRYTIVGHSERRRDFGEDDKTLEEKVKIARSAGIEPIFCIQDAKTPIPEGVKIVAYEPPSAIGTNNPDSPENVKQVVESVQDKGNYIVLYGGSVSPDNVATFFKEANVNGVLVGATNSLDPQKFILILKAAS